ncbi:MAG TPA: PEP-CTERM sorting domain-containing protein [Verrucomicrobiae bacterium]|nr:PEP-CTERM sorting domain-containing protein [Verrucomicrobiae bacterium]
MNKRLVKILCGAVFMCAGTVVANAQTVLFSENFNSATGTPNGYTFGDVVNNSITYADGVGVGGSRGVLIQSDFDNSQGFGGVAFQYQNGNVSGNTSMNLSDYTISFDAKVNKANGGFLFIAQTWPDPGFGGTGPTESKTSSDILLANADTFEHFDINLGTLIPTDAGLDTLGKTWQIAWQMDSGDYGEPSTGDQLVIDNVQLSMVPEPSSIALVLSGVMSGLVFLRRRKA